MWLGTLYQWSVSRRIKFAMVNFIRRFWQQGEVMHNWLQFQWKQCRKAYLLPERNLIGTQKSVTSGVLLIHCSLDTNDPVSCASYRVSAGKNDPTTRKIWWESGTQMISDCSPHSDFHILPCGQHLVPLLSVFKETYTLRDRAGCLWCTSHTPLWTVSKEQGAVTIRVGGHAAGGTLPLNTPPHE